MRITTRVLFCALVAQLTAPLTASAEDITIEKGIEFAKVGAQSLKLDLYRAPKAAKPCPLIVWVHGGAWRRGSRDKMPLRKLVLRGYAVASVDYRLTTIAPFPANVHDIKAAIRFLRAKAKDYHLDPNRITIAGASAGGHLAALVGVTNAHPELEGKVGSNSKIASDVQAVISFYGASNLTTILSQSTPHGLGVRIPALQLLLGAQPDAKPDLARLASPVFHLDKNDPPLFLVHGDQDPQMPINQSHELHGACKKTGVPCVFQVVHGGVHGGEPFYDDEHLAAVVEFLREANPPSSDF